jgi:hypothetical protein
VDFRFDNTSTVSGSTVTHLNGPSQKAEFQVESLSRVTQMRLISFLARSHNFSFAVFVLVYLSVCVVVIFAYLVMLRMFRAMDDEFGAGIYQVAL